MEREAKKQSLGNGNGKVKLPQLVSKNPDNDILDKFLENELEDSEEYELGDEIFEDIDRLIDDDDELKLYLKEIRKVPLLTADEEIKLANNMEEGKVAELIQASLDPNDIELQKLLGELTEEGIAAREHMILANTRLVISIAKHYWGRGLSFPDLIEEGNIGLMKAIDKFDKNKGNRLSTYATWWIKQSISRALADQGRTIRVPVHLNDNFGHMYRTITILEHELGRKPNSKEIADRMETSEEKVEFMKDKSRHPYSLQEAYKKNGDNDGELGDYLEDDLSPDPDEVVTEHLLAEKIEKALSLLTPRQADVLKLHFGLVDGEIHTLEEIAKKYGLSRERVRQIEKEALRKLRHPRFSELRDLT